ncbi:MAG TPA: response regulator [Candidatus Sulfopaludibacter sp.]|jgi:CheY-like chemotaxis protein|nr:response regulator [Candidatus Sulfopaludibacter sp.]
MSRLLLAEDDEFSRDMLVRRLERHGFEMIAASDGREALLAARQHRPDLILLDLDMPVMDGRAAMRALRTDPRTFRIPIIVLTAHAEPDDVAVAREAGCCSYETKPVVLRRLLERIEDALKSASSPPPESAP